MIDSLSDRKEFIRKNERVFSNFIIDPEGIGSLTYS